MPGLSGLGISTKSIFTGTRWVILVKLPDGLGVGSSAKRAVVALPEPPRHVFVDGRDRLDTECDCEAVIGGDGIVLSIAAASIVAKVSRDRLMCRLAQDHPGYGFEQHMGYGVPAHLEALDRLGPTIHHRRFFAPVAASRRKHFGEDDTPATAQIEMIMSSEEAIAAI